MSKEIEQALDEQIRDALKLSATPPQERTEKTIPRWTLKRLVEWVKTQFRLDCSRQTICKTLKKLGFSWKKARKLLNKGDTKKRAEYLQKIQELLDKALHQEELLVYMDEAHIHLDTDEGYGWSVKGERAWISSCSPGRTKVSFYGVYIYNLGEVRILPHTTANGINTIDVLNILRSEFPHQAINLVWDGAPYHRSQIVRDAAVDMKIHLQPLSAYRTHLISFQAVFATDSRLSISRIKHRLSLALERSSVRSKFLTKLLHLSTQAFDLSITHLAATGTNPDCPFVSFSAFDGLVESSN